MRHGYSTNIWGPRRAGGCLRAGVKAQPGLARGCVLYQFQPSFQNGRNHCANILSASSKEKMMVKNWSSVSSVRPVCVSEPSSLLRLSMSCICTTLAPKFCSVGSLVTKPVHVTARCVCECAREYARRAHHYDERCEEVLEWVRGGNAEDLALYSPEAALGLLGLARLPVPACQDVNNFAPLRIGAGLDVVLAARVVPVELRLDGETVGLGRW